MIARLFFAIRKYLCLRHAPGVIVASQVIAFLVVITCLVVMPLTSTLTLECYNDWFRAVRRFWQGL
jgi:hypothetical protein